MKVINYEFFLEHLWKNQERFLIPFPKVRIWTTSVFNKLFGRVDLTILEAIFVSHNNLRDINYVKILISNVLQVINGELAIAVVNCTAESLEIRKDRCRPIDNLEIYGSDPPVDGPNSWNKTTPLELQYLPTEEILKLFMDWLEFLLTIENMCLVPKAYVIEEFQKNL